LCYILIIFRGHAGIDGTEVATRNGFILFECLLKDKRFAHVVLPIRLTPFKSYSYCYKASMDLMYEDVRGRINPRDDKRMHNWGRDEL
jgi:hypothetical protein